MLKIPETTSLLLAGYFVATSGAGVGLAEGIAVEELMKASVGGVVVVVESLQGYDCVHSVGRGL